MTEKVYNILGIQQSVMLCRIKNKNSNYCVFLRPITEEEETEIDNNAKKHGQLEYIRPNGDFVYNDDIHMYGKIDFTNEDDLDIIEKFNFIDDGWSPNFIPSTFDFDKGIYSTIDNKLKGSPTFDCIKWFKYCYVLIGKPERIIVYSVKI